LTVGQVGRQPGRIRVKGEVVADGDAGVVLVVVADTGKVDLNWDVEFLE
jgi:hypothetical protein